ncbi:MAG: hypothetical protein WBB45_16170 [Cyclobacteriaceae bacterium]
MAIQNKIFTVSKYDLSALVNNAILYKEAVKDMFQPAPHWIGRHLISKLSLEYITIDAGGKVLDVKKEADIYKLYLASVTLKMGMQIALFAYSDILVEIPNVAGGITGPGQDTSMLEELISQLGTELNVKWTGYPFMLPMESYAYGKTINYDKLANP